MARRWQVFIRRTLPEHVGATRNDFKGSDALPRLCFGVLVSLVYNRGSGMKDSRSVPGDRTEMRIIKDAVSSGRWEEIPVHLRAMKRLWQEGNGLRVRREREAVLFEEGLANS